MSQHIFSMFHVPSQCKVRVQIGWDRPMQTFYMVVEKFDIDSLPDDDEGLVYSNLDDDGHPTHEIGYFREVAKQHEIRVPDVIWRNAYADSERNVGNKTVFYDCSGNVLPDEQ
jgi:hypothetical protein